MSRILGLLLAASLVLSVASCGKKEDSAPAAKAGVPAILSHVPADTPFLYTNLKPIDEKLLEEFKTYEYLDVARPSYANMLRDVADDLEVEGEDTAQMQQGLRHMADYLAEHDARQIIADSGLKLDGLAAVYGLGLSPVMRAQADGEKFSRWVSQFVDAFGTQLEQASVDGQDYRYADLPGIRMRVIVAAGPEQAIVGLLPEEADDTRVRLALGVDMPDDNVQSAGTVEAMAKEYGYDGHLVSYLDFTQLPALIAGAQQDPMLLAVAELDEDLRTGLQGLANESCEADLARIANRVPQLNLGYTKLTAKQQGVDMTLVLAEDIRKAFSGLGESVPGLGKMDKAALMDVAGVLPVRAIRDFGTAQAQAILDDPFSCPALSEYNELAELALQELPKLGMPPFASLLGQRFVLEEAPLPIENLDALMMLSTQLDQVKARVLVAMNDPMSVVDMATAMLPPLAGMNLSDDGQVHPVELPPELAAMTQGLDAWVAVNEQAIGLSVGGGGDTTLDEMMKTTSNDKDLLGHLHVLGRFYGDLLRTSGNLAASGGEMNADELASLESLVELFDNLIEDYTMVGKTSEHGLLLQTEVNLK